MPFSDGWEIICYALDAEEEDRLFLRWAVRYQEHMGFDVFKAWISGDGEDNRSGKEILGIVKNIIG